MILSPPGEKITRSPIGSQAVLLGFHPKMGPGDFFTRWVLNLCTCTTSPARTSLRCSHVFPRVGAATPPRVAWGECSCPRWPPGAPSTRVAHGPVPTTAPSEARDASLVRHRLPEPTGGTPLPGGHRDTRQAQRRHHGTAPLLPAGQGADCWVLGFWGQAAARPGGGVG